MNLCSLIEPLESRIAPAVITGNVLTYNDIDGDAVTITFATAAQLTPNQFTFDTAFDSTEPQQLQLIDLRSLAPAFASTERQQCHLIDLSSLPTAEGASIVMKVTQTGAGNGRADAGYINAHGSDLAKVKLAGDLGRIDVGDDDFTAALKSLSAYSIGAANLE